MQFYKQVGEATLNSLNTGETTLTLSESIFTNAILLTSRGSNSEFFINLGEATLNLSESIFTNAILQTGRGSNSEFFKHRGNHSQFIKVYSKMQFYKQVGEATLNSLNTGETTLHLSESIFKNAILQTGRGSNSEIFIH